MGGKELDSSASETSKEKKDAPAAKESPEISSRLVRVGWTFQPITAGLSSVALPLGTAPRENLVQRKILVSDRSRWFMCVKHGWVLRNSRLSFNPFSVYFCYSQMLLSNHLIQQLHHYPSALLRRLCVACNTQDGNGIPSAAAATVTDDASARGFSDQGLYLTSSGPNHDLLKKMNGEDAVSVYLKGHDLW